MSLNGDFSRLTRAADAVRSLPEALPRAQDRVAEGMLEQLHEEFVAGVDPSGSPWAPLAPATVAKGRSAPPLTDTGRMAASAQARAERDGVAVIIDPPAQFLQLKRPMLPERRMPAHLVRAAVAEELDAVRRQV